MNTLQEKKYICRIICSDCTYEDDKGCFDGEPAIDEFNNLEDAIKFAEKCTRNSGTWDYTLEDEDGNRLPKEIVNPVFNKLYGYDYE